MPRVVITGFGIVSPVGNNKDEFWSSLKAGKSGIDRLQAFDPSEFSCHVAGELKGFDPLQFLNKKQLRRTDPFTQYAMAASQMAVDDAKLELDSLNPLRCGVLVGSGIGGLQTIEQQVVKYQTQGPSKISPFLIPMLITNIAGGEVAIRFGFKGPNYCVVTACATSTHCIGEAYRMIQRGQADLFLAGGSEAAITELGFGGFCAARALTSGYNDAPQKASRPFDGKRDGFVMAEGAATLVVEELEHAQKRGAHIYAEVVGYGLSEDAYHITSPSPEGEGAARCMASAIHDAGIEPSQVDYINAHGTSTALNDKFETQAIKTVLGDHASKVAISSTKSMTGHMLGATGGAELGATALMIEDSVIIPTINQEEADPECDLDYVPNEPRNQKITYAMSNSFGFGGQNASVLLKKFS